MNAKSKIRSAYLVALAIWLIALMVVLNGCARFTTVQTETRDENKKTTTITTRATAYTLWSSKSELAKFKATQTEKSQSASVGSLNQSATETNFVGVVEAVAKGVAAALNPVKTP